MCVILICSRMLTTPIPNQKKRVESTASQILITQSFATMEIH